MNFGPEQLVHGQPWGHLHGGYFSDPGVARPLVETILKAAQESRPDIIIDLGGGTGFLLSQLRKSGMGAKTGLVDLDSSEAQLSEAGRLGIACARGTVDGFCRREVVPAGQKALFAMRSVLHYSGEAGLTPLLRHIRAQALTGEYWVHQTACFVREEEADGLNALYRKMRTDKWYPALADLRERLAETGWQVESVLPAPALHLDSDELGLRYGLDSAEIRRIGAEMAKEFGAENVIFQLRPGGFRAALHYHIFICRAR